ncbi:MAG TPA: peptide chain release factor N(5)-glutamine methyltransferase [Melioribacteraceae bacterium]|nr:peptide chain release factor N(5)-glutamine methyltransferase [Melioribacteraceae bacterium]
MLTVLNALKLATEYFEKKEIPSARINAELLLSHLLKCKRLDLYLRFEQPLSENEVDEFRSMIARRGKYEPVQYIIGNTDFYGLNFLVNPSVLIPRPETEILVETIINNHKFDGPIKILDIGSGSGNIAVSLAKNLSDGDLLSIDISEEALKTAESNAGRLNVNNVKFIKADILSNGFAADSHFDLIVSNPPYISDSEYGSLQKEIILYEPKNALSDNMDGLNFYRRISSFADEKLNPGGYLYFEIGLGQSDSVKSILENNGFGEIKIIQDYQRIDRVIYGVKK